MACPVPTLALGGQLKVTFALGRGRHAFLSHHLGDLDYYEAYRAAVESIDHYEALFAFRPELIVHDLHPDYATTRYARELDAGDSPARRPAPPRARGQLHGRQRSRSSRSSASRSTAPVLAPTAQSGAASS